MAGDKRCIQNLATKFDKNEKAASKTDATLERCQVSRAAILEFANNPTVSPVTKPLVYSTVNDVRNELDCTVTEEKVCSTSV
jgi:hypothetical protein